ncbi:SMP-30/gluconolactonase/LRE family protein [Phycicoccus flavus]|uniref:SMP-30/gluconolactonase/LRE family protein n=1 Tax=Phycicoccus flavus TaxID=2502783 RepID=A0A8T6R1E2_9MICO|nr:SMP-30/gluconolactonase/LRE family protein [Phycicoccus flavus]NHA67404.1 SMP-30/gluconolactonase/LRE family protein [Phycicoccus flavus]
MTEHPLETVVEDLAFGESVRWHDGRVWFCDWGDGEVVSVRPDGSDRTVHATVSAGPVCVDWDARGRLLVVEGARGRLLRVDAGGGEPDVVADLGAVSPYPWNEVVGHPSGTAFVNGIGFDMMRGAPAGPGQIALVTDDGTVREVAGDLAFPNGMALGPDGATLLVAESHASRITAFTVTADGLTDRRVFAEVPGSAPDGIALTADGSVWYADVPNRCCRRVREGGEVLAEVALDRGGFSCAATEDGDLYVAATVWDEATFGTRRGLLLRARGAGRT